jgi:hypothetical protein
MVAETANRAGRAAMGSSRSVPVTQIALGPVELVHDSRRFARPDLKSGSRSPCWVSTLVVVTNQSAHLDPDGRRQIIVF